MAFFLHKLLWKYSSYWTVIIDLCVCFPEHLLGRKHVLFIFISHSTNKLPCPGSRRSTLYWTMEYQSWSFLNKTMVCEVIGNILHYKIIPWTQWKVSAADKVTHTICSCPRLLACSRQSEGLSPGLYLQSHAGKGPQLSQGMKGGLHLPSPLTNFIRHMM